jgi:uncharacterized protein YegP (UPF0339 family)
MGMFELKTARGGKFSFNLKADNGKVILTSQTYKTRRGAQNGIASVKKNARKEANFDRRKSASGKTYFVLLAANKEIVGKSQMYASSSSLLAGLRSVKKNAPGAKVKDLT